MKKIIGLLFALLTVLILSSSSILALEDQAESQDVQSQVGIHYRAHISDIGWESQYARDGQTAGTTGQHRQLESLELVPEGLPEGVRLVARAHIAQHGWQNEVTNGGFIGTTGINLSMQAVEMRLSGDNPGSSIYYRTHVSELGWLGWARDGQTAGTTGLNLPIEAVEIKIVPNGSPTPEQNARAAITNEEINGMRINYNLFQPSGAVFTGINGSTAATNDTNIPFVALTATLDTPFDGSAVTYQAFISNRGWIGWNKNGEASGDGVNQIEALQFSIHGPISLFYDVYYRVQANRFKWLDWAKNGTWAGTKDGNMNITGLEVRLVRKGQPAPGSMYRSFMEMPGGKYFQGRGIFVWLAQQMVFVQNENNQLIFMADCTTGTPNSENATPTGNFRILRKSRNTYLSGADYYSHVDYWIPFIGSVYGFHDADWRNFSQFGNDVYTYDGSHGCINMRDPEIAIFNSIIRIGDLVVIR